MNNNIISQTKQPVNYLNFNSPIHVVWRSGSATDPFVDRVDITKVVNQRVALLEIPDELHRVRIAGMFEINYENFTKYSLATNEFYCDYTNGFVYFNQIKEAVTVTLVYKGRGMVLYPSSRIIHYDGTDGSQSLLEIIENSKELILDLSDKTNTFEEVLKNMIVATNNTILTTDESKEVTEEAKKQIELIRDAYETTVLIYQPYVQTYNDIATTYPLPDVGWTVQVFDTGVRYRWNGKSWVPIDALGGNIPLATEDYDGLMSKDNVKKLNSISSNVNNRVVVFFVPQDITTGVQDPFFTFPFDGIIREIKATVMGVGAIDTAVRVEKSLNYSAWNEVGVVNIPQSGNVGITTNFADDAIAKDTTLRLNVLTNDTDIQNLSVNLTIELNQ